MTSRSIQAPFNGETRQADGMTVFAEEQETKETRAFVRTKMPLTDALLEICAMIDALEGDWKITCISTPTTIWRDMQGDRRIVKQNSRGRGRQKDANGTSSVQFAEATHLSRIDRMDLWGEE